MPFQTLLEAPFHKALSQFISRGLKNVNILGLGSFVYRTNPNKIIGKDIMIYIHRCPYSMIHCRKLETA